MKKSWEKVEKHCQRHNGPRVLTLYLELSLKVEMKTSCRDYSRYGVNSLGPLCLWQCLQISLSAVLTCTALAMMMKMGEKKNNNDNDLDEEVLCRFSSRWGCWFSSPGLCKWQPGWEGAVERGTSVPRHPLYQVLPSKLNTLSLVTTDDISTCYHKCHHAKVPINVFFGCLPFLIMADLLWLLSSYLMHFTYIISLGLTLLDQVSLNAWHGRVNTQTFAFLHKY